MVEKQPIVTNAVTRTVSSQFKFRCQLPKASEVNALLLLALNNAYVFVLKLKGDIQ